MHWLQKLTSRSPVWPWKIGQHSTSARTSILMVLDRMPSDSFAFCVSGKWLQMLTALPNDLLVNLDVFQQSFPMFRTSPLISSFFPSLTIYCRSFCLMKSNSTAWEVCSCGNHLHSFLRISCFKESRESSNHDAKWISVIIFFCRGACVQIKIIKLVY